MKTRRAKIPKRKNSRPTPPARPTPRVRLGAALGLTFAVLLLQGCLPSQATFEFGLGTSEVVGTVELDAGSAIEDDAIIVVQKNHHKFLPADFRSSPFDSSPFEASRSLTHPTAHLAMIDHNGGFAISMPVDVVSMEIWFVAPGRLTEVFKYSRSAGIGRVSYRAFLPVARDWRNHFYTFLVPQLQHFIVEARYALSERDQKQLADWLDAQKNRLEGRR